MTLPIGHQNITIIVRQRENNSGLGLRWNADFEPQSAVYKDSKVG